jgi:UDP-N-acetylmuramoyl-L-alanyl-D-glutamate--2,6-diaminopimelate ligase
LASALASLLLLGAEPADALRACESVPPVPGRFESIPNDQGLGVIVDYAHTPDALEALLSCVRGLGPSRVLTVFGCGGDRDRTKRPKMARAASQGSDVVVLTSDNPRTEDPEAIMDEAARGLVPGVESRRIADRREAISWAVAAAGPGDVVVIAGKGHEDYQIIGRTKHPMSDREMAREALEARR